MSPPRRVRVEARAKLNLGLAVGPRRSDGFHELATVFQSVSLADTLVAGRRRRGFSLRVRHVRAAAAGSLSSAARAAVPAGRGNLALAASRLTCARLGLPGGVGLVLVKRIPALAGLGGGSADAAAAIVATLALHGVRLPLADRMAIGAELGSDVPFALLGGTALGLGRGERLRRLPPARNFRAVVVVPPWRVSTADAFRRIDRSKYGLTRWGSKLRFANRLGRSALEPRLALRLGNTFEEALGARRRDFLDLCDGMREAGLVEPRMTGSGSAIFGLVPPRVAMAGILQGLSGRGACYVVRPARSGLRAVRVQ